MAASAVLATPIFATTTSISSPTIQQQKHLNLHFSTSFPRSNSTSTKTPDMRCLAKGTPDSEVTPAMSETRLSELFAFGGAAPERINGRLAMVGFVAAMAVEVARGQNLMAQISEGGGGAWFAGISVLLSLASLAPLLKGVSVKSKSEGVMTEEAEMVNGRMAMLGLVALAFTEYVKGGGTLV